jgi:small-conductance mechanosensitive channel
LETDKVKPKVKLFTLFLLVSTLACLSSALAEEFTESLQQPIRQSVAIRKETQQTRERWQAEKEKRIAAYEALEAQHAELIAAREALVKRLSAEQTRNRALVDQLAKLEAISRNIEPFLQETHRRLSVLLSRDPALLPEERHQRLGRLQTLLGDPAGDVGEKYRKTMEALFIEAEYGNTVDVYQQTITVADQSTTVTILRLGRLALFYQSMDRKTCGYFDRAVGKWRPLSGSHTKGIRTAIEITGKQRPAQMVSLPIGRMVAK